MPSQQWADQNRPSDDPDYQRLVDVTQAVESEGARDGMQQVLNRRFDYDVAQTFAMRRTEETSREVKLENPDRDALLRLLFAAWAEGLVFGAHVYSKERRGRESEPFLDRLTLANINQALVSAGEQGRAEAFRDVLSEAALTFVGLMRALKANEVLKRQIASVTTHQMVSLTVSAHWLDGFLTGIVFEELGGHRDKA